MSLFHENWVILSNVILFLFGVCFYLKFFVVGRILNRFSKDTNLIDDFLSFQLFDLVQVIIHSAKIRHFCILSNFNFEKV